MVLKELKKFASLGLNAAKMRKKDIEKHLAPLVKAGKITSKEASSFASDIINVSRTHQDKIRSAIANEIKRNLKKQGYVKVKVQKRAVRKNTAQRSSVNKVNSSKVLSKKKGTKRKTAKRKLTKQNVAKKKVAKKKVVKKKTTKKVRKKATRNKSR